MKRLALGAAVALVVAAVSAFLLVGSSATDPAGPGPEPDPVRAEDDGPPDVAASSGERTEQGARAAAITYATATQDWLYLTDDQIDAAVRAIATHEAAPALSAETVAELRTARDALASTPGRVWWLVRPLASQLERFDPSSARVVVWTVTVLSAADVALPQAEWLRVALELTWVDGAWRLQAVSDTPGPTPMTGINDAPWQPEPFDEALEGFERVSTTAVGR